MNSSIPRTGLPSPPEAWVSAVPCARGSAGVSAVVSAAIVALPSVRRGPAAPGVDPRPFRADLGEVVEVVGRRRRGRGPLEGVALPRVVTSDLPVAQGYED